MVGGGGGNVEEEDLGVLVGELGDAGGSYAFCSAGDEDDFGFQRRVLGELGVGIFGRWWWWWVVVVTAAFRGGGGHDGGLVLRFWISY